MTDEHRAPRWASVALVAATLANVLAFAGSSLAGRFAADDMMNMGGYWTQGWWREIAANVLFFTSAYRPMGAFYYLPLLHIFGLDARPYHVLTFAILLVNCWLLYRLALALTGWWLPAGLAAFLVSFHAGMADSFYVTSTIYDTLCFCFYYAALGFYVRIRRGGAIASVRQLAVVAVLYACSLNSKEMAVSFPLAVLGYELAFHWPDPRQWRRWLGAEGRLVWVTGLMTVAFIAGKLLGPDSLAAMPAYRPHFTWQQFWQSSSHHADLILQRFQYFTAPRVALLWAALLALALACRRADLRFCWWLMMVTPLPIVFLNRSHSCVYVIWAAWAMYGAILAVAAARWVAGRLRWRAAVALPALAAVALAGWHVRENVLVMGYLRPTMQDWSRTTDSAIRALRALHPAIRPHSTVVFLNDPFQDWDMLFILQLWTLDPTLTIHLHRKTPLTDAALAKADYLFRFEPDGTLLQVKKSPPGR